MSSGGESETLGFSMSILWALFVASAFPIGGLASTYIKIPKRIQADLAATSAGIFLGTIAFSLVDDAIKVGESDGQLISGSADLLIGFVVGAVAFSFADYAIKKREEKEESKNKSLYASASESKNKASSSSTNNKEAGGKAKSVLVGTLVDSTPETILLAIIIALPLAGLVPSAVALFLGNITASLEGTKRLYEKGGKKRIVLSGWMAVFGVVLAAGPLGYYLVQSLSRDQLAIIIGFAAGALMAFVTQELIPKAFERANVHIGLSVAFGFLVAFALFHFV
ncbi:MAG: hypothetical protein M3299_00075 [Thermoproteota archaeon]|nr:hypothetical protein [Thermoproteota archaeon]